MFTKLQIRRAKKHDAKKLQKMLLAINPAIEPEEIEALIEEKQVMLLKKRKKIKAAFVYTIFGIAGIYTLMYVKKIVVDNQSRGKGVGSFLLEQIKTFSRAKKVNFNLLYSLKKATNFYKKNKLENWGRFFWWKN